MNNKKLNIILKWSYRILCGFGLLIIGILLVVYGIDKIDTATMSLLLAGIIAGLSWQGVKSHPDMTSDIKELKES